MGDTWNFVFTNNNISRFPEHNLYFSHSLSSSRSFKFGQRSFILTIQQKTLGINLSKFNKVYCYNYWLIWIAFSTWSFVKIWVDCKMEIWLALKFCSYFNFGFDEIVSTLSHPPHLSCIQNTWIVRPGSRVRTDTILALNNISRIKQWNFDIHDGHILV